MPNFKVDGTITESLVEDEWRCSAYSLTTGALILTTVVTGSTFTLSPFTNSDAVLVTVSPKKIKDKWQDSVSVALNDIIISTNPTATPYYFKCITAGTTGATEPAWNVVTSSQTTDGSAIWEVVELIALPISKSPIIPQPV